MYANNGLWIRYSLGSSPRGSWSNADNSVSVLVHSLSCQSLRLPISRYYKWCIVVMNMDINKYSDWWSSFIFTFSIDGCMDAVVLSLVLAFTCTLKPYVFHSPMALFVYIAMWWNWCMYLQVHIYQVYYSRLHWRIITCAVLRLYPQLGFDDSEDPAHPND
jgi:hypothetical protein